ERHEPGERPGRPGTLSRNQVDRHQPDRRLPRRLRTLRRQRKRRKAGTASYRRSRTTDFSDFQRAFSPKYRSTAETKPLASPTRKMPLTRLVASEESARAIVTSDVRLIWANASPSGRLSRLIELRCQPVALSIEVSTVRLRT